MRRKNLSQIDRALPTLCGLLSGIASVALLPEVPSPGKSVVEVGFPQVVDAALNDAFFLTVADIDEPRPAQSCSFTCEPPSSKKTPEKFGV